MTDAPPIRRRRVLETEDELRALSNPLRTRILHAAADPVSVRELADRLDVPVTRLYFHMNLLVDHGFLEVASVEKVGAQLTRRFVRSAEDFSSSDDLVTRLGSTSAGQSLMASVVIEQARAQVERYVRDGAPSDADATQSVMRLTPELAEEYIERVGLLFQEFRDRVAGIPDDETELYALTHIIGPLEGGTS